MRISRLITSYKNLLWSVGFNDSYFTEAIDSIFYWFSVIIITETLDKLPIKEDESKRRIDLKKQ